ncbi:hypothetical protein [Paraglaciecola polaris]|uniref:Iron reductase n=1 Tax=Paraglaciecola polaris LMG 21857 TaxID=1129793 RepID=K7A0L4_9ALTE|nr:hypothetical protein [Paraglaciecola polaris]GAC34498.1 hypothetical protein GPLA_3610 [Paraglaciecola polaris LMG 21857]|tara:strand:- start:2142 stop:2894 length:753 start_codon:yes stop_codon:yes gene_type:complete
MNNQERHIVTMLVFLMLLLWGGFVWHRDPNFPGSFNGSMIGIVAAFFMFWPLFYLIIKRIKPLRKWVTKRVSMPSLLLLHIYAGVLGPILGILHSAHKFDSFVGIALVLLMLTVVISGFIGRYILSLISSRLRDKTVLKEELNSRLDIAKQELRNRVCSTRIRSLSSNHRTLMPAITAIFGERSSPRNYERDVFRLIDSLSDVDYSIKIHDTAKLWFKRWLKFHIAISLILYVLLVFHISTEIYFGLRWL